MGREIRRVPLDWEHPQNENGHYRPLHDETFETAFAAWWEGREAWIADKDGERTRIQDAYYHGKVVYYEEDHGTSPHPDDYRPAWADTMLGFCMYETVSEGTPASPVFATLDALEDWLVQEGTSRKNAHAFCKSGWAPSFFASPATGFVSGLDAAATLDDE